MPKSLRDEIGARETWIQERLGEYRQPADALDGCTGPIERTRDNGAHEQRATRGGNDQGCRRTHSATAAAVTETAPSHPHSEDGQTGRAQGSLGSPGGLNRIPGS